MNIPDTRAAAKRSPNSADDRVYVHAVLFNDPVWRRNGDTLRRLRFQREPVNLPPWDAVEAICSRRVRLVYPMTFHSEDEDACPDCKQLTTILRLDRERYPEQARLIGKRVQEEDERRTQERERRRQERKNVRREANRFFGAVDESDDDEPPPDLMELLRRADRDDPDASHTA
jgi:hypothetical protein